MMCRFMATLGKAVGRLVHLSRVAAKELIDYLRNFADPIFIPPRYRLLLRRHDKVCV